MTPTRIKTKKAMRLASLVSYCRPRLRVSKMRQLGFGFFSEPAIRRAAASAPFPWSWTNQKALVATMQLMQLRSLELQERRYKGLQRKRDRPAIRLAQKHDESESRGPTWILAASRSRATAIQRYLDKHLLRCPVEAKPLALRLTQMGPKATGKRSRYLLESILYDLVPTV